jgi:hypothetical protein
LVVSTRDGQWTQFGFHFEGTVSCLDVDGTYAIIGIDTTFSGFGELPRVFPDERSWIVCAGSDTLPSDCDVRVPFGQFASEQVTNET